MSGLGHAAVAAPGISGAEGEEQHQVNQEQKDQEQHQVYQGAGAGGGGEWDMQHNRRIRCSNIS
jgi:hypothetical protein